MLAAKRAGMRYVVITSKHHDGFGLWDSQVTDWDIMGVIYFNEEGKIYRIRDYFDNSGPYEKLKGILPDEQIKMINQLGRRSHPLAESNEPDPQFYRNMVKQLEVMRNAEPLET